MKHYRMLWATGVLWLAVDWLTKQGVVNGWFGSIFTPHQNAGIAFGLPMPLWLQLIASVILIGVIIWLALAEKNRFLNQALFGIILGGAIGNFLSRLSAGYVIDFINFSPFPAFNVADIGITAGLAMLLILNFKNNR